jgi:hypothetical protein
MQDNDGNAMKQERNETWVMEIIYPRCRKTRNEGTSEVRKRSRFIYMESQELGVYYHTASVQSNCD